MNLKTQISCALLLVSISRLCSAEQVSFKNNTDFSLKIIYGFKTGDEFTPQGITDRIMPSASKSLELETQNPQRPNNFFTAIGAGTTVAPHSFAASPGKSAYIISPTTTGALNVS